jgi:hypothetical protein
MYSDTGDTTSLVPGFPIRTSSDPRSVDSSPRHIAASHVLHRLSMPRHPPCALKHLQTQKPRSKNQNCTKQTRRQSSAFASMLATTIQLPNTTPHHQDGATPPTPAITARTTAGVVSGPNSVLGEFRCPPREANVVVHQTPTHYRCGAIPRIA